MFTHLRLGVSAKTNRFYNPILVQSKKKPGLKKNSGFHFLLFLLSSCKIEKILWRAHIRRESKAFVR